MKILEKFTQKQENYFSTRQPAIAFLGDSVTHGCFEIFMKCEKLETKVETNEAYHEKLRSIFAVLYPDVPLNIINAGISGDTAENAVTRLNRDVLSYQPDLVVVCFGLNDSMQAESGLDTYTNSLKKIFTQIKKSDTDVIFMTPNMRTASVDIPFNDEALDSAVLSVIENENEKWLDKYLDAAKTVCTKLDIPVCDCNALWKNLIKNGVKVNNLLSNRVNHPTRQMHWLFAHELVKTIFNN